MEPFSFRRARSATAATFRRLWWAWLIVMALSIGWDLAMGPIYKALPDQTATWVIALDLAAFFISNIFFTALMLLATLRPQDSWRSLGPALPTVSVMVFGAELVIHLPNDVADWVAFSAPLRTSVNLSPLLQLLGWLSLVAMHAALGMSSPASAAERLTPIAALSRGWRLGRRKLGLLVMLCLGAEAVEGIIEIAGSLLLPLDWGDGRQQLISAVQTLWYGAFYMFWGALFLELRRAFEPATPQDAAVVFD